LIRNDTETFLQKQYQLQQSMDETFESNMNVRDKNSQENANFHIDMLNNDYLNEENEFKQAKKEDRLPRQE